MNNLKCVLHDVPAVTTAARIPVCAECDRQYQEEGAKHLPMEERVFWRRLLEAHGRQQFLNGMEGLPKDVVARFEVVFDLMGEVDKTMAIYERIRSGTREPISIMLQKAENAEVLTELVIALNRMVKRWERAAEWAPVPQ